MIPGTYAFRGRRDGEKYEVKIMKDEELGTKGTKGDGAEVRGLGRRRMIRFQLLWSQMSSFS